MKRALLIKMSSLGDVVHALPAVTDAAAHGWQFDWVVEEAFADIPAQHPAVSNVQAIAWRRWRKSLLKSRAEMRDFRAQLKSQQYDLVLDSQGLIKSAAVARLTGRDDLRGFDAESAREPIAARAYHHAFAVPRRQHAVHRQRQLFAAALDYPLAETTPDYGLSRPPSDDANPVCVLLHGTTWDSKHYPDAQWLELAQLAGSAGYAVAVTWGNEVERRRAVEFEQRAGVAVWPKQSLAELMRNLQAADLVIGVDSGITHLAAALSVPTVGLYGSTDAELTGCIGASARAMSVDFSCAPCLSRACTYQGEASTSANRLIHPPCYATLAPQEVWRVGMETVRAHRVLHI